MNIKCDLIIDYEDIKKVRKVLKSVEVDNFNYVKSKIDSNPRRN